MKFKAKSLSLIGIAVIISIFTIFMIVNTGKDDVGLSKGVINTEQAETNKQTEVKPGMSAIFMNTNLVSKIKDGMLTNLTFQNGENNNYSQVLRIVEDETGDVLYESPIVDPGYKIESDYINELSKGEYNCTAEIDLLDIDTYDLVNTVNIKLKLTVIS